MGQSIKVVRVFFKNGPSLPGPNLPVPSSTTATNPYTTIVTEHDPLLNRSVINIFNLKPTDYVTY